MTIGNGPATTQEMTDVITVNGSNSKLIVENARLATVDIEPDMYAVLYSEEGFKGKTIRIYDDEQLTGFERIGSI